MPVSAGPVLLIRHCGDGGLALAGEAGGVAEAVGSAGAGMHPMGTPSGKD